MKWTARAALCSDDIMRSSNDKGCMRVISECIHVTSCIVCEWDRERARALKLNEFVKRKESNDRKEKKGKTVKTNGGGNGVLTLPRLHLGAPLFWFWLALSASSLPSVSLGITFCNESTFFDCSGWQTSKWGLWICQGKQWHPSLPRLAKRVVIFKFSTSSRSLRPKLVPGRKIGVHVCVFVWACVSLCYEAIQGRGIKTGDKWVILILSPTEQLRRGE